MAKKRASQTEVSFLEFFLAWAEIKKWEVPGIHIQVVDWLEHRTKRNGVLEVFRGAGKSTLVGLYIAWKLKCNPEHRFLILAADDVTAWKMSFDAQHIIQTHPLCEGMKGGKLWQTIRWSVAGNTDPRNASVSSHGVMSNITSSRADEVIFDDVEVPKNVKTQLMRDELRMRIDETTHILVPGGKKLFIGTPHHFETIYVEQAAKDETDVLILPLFQDGIEMDCNNVWPERFTHEEVAYRKKECVTGATWKSQYLLQPVPIHDVRLDPLLMIPYEHNPIVRFANGEVAMWIEADGEQRRIVGAACYWDVSLGKISSDDSVLSLILTDDMGRLYWQLAECLPGGIDEQCSQIASLVKQFQIPGICIETNGPGGFVPAILRKHLSGLRCGISQQFQNSNKAKRILDAFEPALSGGFLYINADLQRTKLVSQMREWQPDGKGQRDDILDSGAGAIHLTPIRIGRGVQSETTAFADWRPGNGSIEVNTDWGW